MVIGVLVIGLFWHCVVVTGYLLIVLGLFWRMLVDRNYHPFPDPTNN